MDNSVNVSCFHVFRLFICLKRNFSSSVTSTLSGYAKPQGFGVAVRALGWPNRQPSCTNESITSTCWGLPTHSCALLGAQGRARPPSLLNPTGGRWEPLGGFSELSVVGGCWACVLLFGWLVVLLLFCFLAVGLICSFLELM